MVFTPQNTEVVVMPYAEVDQKVVSFAAREMTNFLSRAFGAAVPVKNVLDPNKFSIVLGSNTWSLAAGIDTANLPQDGFVTRTKGNAVYIAGLDENKDPGTRDESFARATLFGVYEFLEKYVGCRSTSRANLAKSYRESNPSPCLRRMPSARRCSPSGTSRQRWANGTTLTSRRSDTFRFPNCV